MSDSDVFDRVHWSRVKRRFCMDLRVSGTWDMVPLADLVGRKVNIGDKDGGVYEGVTVAAFEEDSGYLVLEGGVSGSRFRPEEARPLEGTERLLAYDVARGVLLPEGDA